MRRMVLLGVAVCLLITVGLLPVKESKGDLVIRRSNPEWRAGFQVGSAQYFLYLLELRDSVLTYPGDEADVPVIRVDSSVPDRARQAIEEILRTRHDRVAADTSMRVVALVLPGAVPGERSGYFGMAQIVPTAPHGRTCIAVMHLGSWDMRRFQRGQSVSPYSLAWMREQGLGICGFYAAFGLPGRHVAAWLEDQAYAPAGDLDWLSDPLTVPQPIDDGERLEIVRSADLTFLGCAAGDVERCREAIYSRPGADRVPVAWADFRPRGIASPRVLGGRARPRDPLGPWTAAYLGDMVGHFGRETFARFWTSDDSLEAAFASATGQQLDEWTMRWAQAYIGVPHSGNRVRFSAVVSAFVAVGVVVGGAALFALRRQVA